MYKETKAPVLGEESKRAIKAYEQVNELYSKIIRGSSLTENEQSRLIEQTNDLNKMCKNNPPIAKDLEKVKGIILFIKGEYTGDMFWAISYCARLKGTDEITRKIAKENAAVLELLEEPRYRTRREATRVESKEMQAAQIIENEGTQEEKKERKNTPIQSIRQFYSSGIVAYRRMSEEAKRRGEPFKSGKEQEMVENHVRIEIARLDLALAMLKSDDVRAALYKEYGDFLHGLPVKEAKLTEKIAELNVGIRKIEAGRDEKQNAWFARRNQLIDLGKRSESQSMSIIKAFTGEMDSENKENEKKLKETKTEAEKHVEEMKSLLLAKNALLMLRSIT